MLLSLCLPKTFLNRLRQSIIRLLLLLRFWRLKLNEFDWRYRIVFYLSLLRTFCTFRRSLPQEFLDLCFIDVLLLLSYHLDIWLVSHHLKQIVEFQMRDLIVQSLPLFLKFTLFLAFSNLRISNLFLRSFLFLLRRRKFLVQSWSSSAHVKFDRISLEGLFWKSITCFYSSFLRLLLHFLILWLSLQWLLSLCSWFCLWPIELDVSVDLLRLGSLDSLLQEVH